MAEKKVKRTKYATVTCNIHGTQRQGANWTAQFKQLNCAIPKTKREEQGGCPICARK